MIYYSSLDRVIVVDGEQCLVPVYIDDGDHDGAHPGFFSQVTRGKRINDVCHAKLVGEFGSLQTPDAFYRGTRLKSSGTYKNPRSETYYVWQAYPGVTMLVEVSIPSVKGNALTGYWPLSVSCTLCACPARPEKIGSRGFLVGAFRKNAVMYHEKNGNKSRWFSDLFSEYGLPQAGDPLPSIDKTYETYADAVQGALRFGLEQMQPWCDAYMEAESKYFEYNRSSYGRTTNVLGVDSYQVPELRELPFILNEKDIYCDHVDPILLGNGLENGSYWRNWLIQHAYVSALQSIPKLNDNSVSNLLELVGFIKALVVDHRIEIPRSLQDAWLSYRYVYSTTKLDVEEAVKFMHTNYTAPEIAKECKGSSSCNYKDTYITCRCSMKVSSTELSYVDKIWTALRKYGLSPSFYVVWDMIPYSFIVDWFIPIGDMMSVLDAGMEFHSSKYDIIDVCFSLSYYRVIGNYKYRCYTRWQDKPLPYFNGLYWLDKSGPSAKTVVRRVMDVASIVTD
jgi:hypothetical protein